MPTLTPRQPPPPDYYAQNLRFLLSEVQARCGDLLREPEQRFIEAVQAASTPAQRLMARLLTRSRPWLRIDSLEYAEVGDLGSALHELRERRLIEPLAPAPANALLDLLTRAELQACFPSIRAATKPEWIRCCLSRYPDALIRARLAEHHPWIGVAVRREFSVCQVLFFAGDGQDLSAFVMQDLGIHTYERYPLDGASRAFATRGELDRYLGCRRLAGHVVHLDAVPELAPLLRRALAAEPLCRLEQRARDRLLNRLGQWHERRGELDDARACYQSSTSPPARERLARLLHRQGEQAALEALLERIRLDPWGPEEIDFTTRFPGRRRACGPAVTTCLLSDGTPPRIERHALNLLTSNGGRGWHLENLLPLGLAGLAFWEEVFAPLPGAFSHPFQLGPHDLFWPDFARARRHLLDARLASLRAPGALAERLRTVHQAKNGISNRLVHWGAFSNELLNALLANVPERSLLTLADHTIRNLHRSRTGFPDLLLIYGPGAWEVVEVKGPTDQLQPAQRVWLGALEALSVPARVLRFRAA